MTLYDAPNPWEVDGKQAYFPLLHEGTLVGFCKREYIRQIATILNEQEKLRKALRLACFELSRKSGGDKNKVDEVIKKYLAMAERPKYGTRAIAAMLKDRQVELNVSDQEFIRFCDSYRLPPEELRDIYAGEEIVNSQLGPLARILGTTMEELIEVRDGPVKK